MSKVPLKFTKVDADMHDWRGPGASRSTLGRDDYNPRFWRGNLYDAAGGLCFNTNGSYAQVKKAVTAAMRREIAAGRI